MKLVELKEIPYFDQAPKRIISLIPSMTENLFLLGFGSFVVGITDYCIHPENMLVDIPRVGGPKSPDYELILELAPDLVILNQEESTPEVVKSLDDAGIRMWVTFPKTVNEAIEILFSVLGIFKNDRAVIQLKSLIATLDIVKLSTNELKKVRYFCPIWQDKYKDINWMMTFNGNTYPDDLLSICGGENIFADRTRRYPLEADLGIGEAEDTLRKDTRYPRVNIPEIIEQNPELIFLPSEPFEFDQNNLSSMKILFSETDAGKNDRIILVDGSLLFWPGVRVGRALQILPNLLNSM